MVSKVIYTDITNKQTNGESGAALVNDTKRAINEVIDLVRDIPTIYVPVVSQGLPSTTFYGRPNDVDGNIYKFRPNTINSVITNIRDIPIVTRDLAVGSDFAVGVDITVSAGTDQPTGSFSYIAKL